MTSHGVTGRDQFISIQAHFYAIAAIQKLPEQRQEYSNMCDMCAVVRTLSPHTIAHQVTNTFLHTGTVVDLWPDGGLSDEEHVERSAFLEMVNPLIAESMQCLKSYSDSVAAEKQTEN